MTGHDEPAGSTVIERTGSWPKNGKDTAANAVWDTAKTIHDITSVCFRECAAKDAKIVKYPSSVQVSFGVYR